MAGKQTDTSNTFGKEGKEQMTSILAMQRELVEAYEQASRGWMTRMRSEMDFWLGLSMKLAAIRSVPEALETYQKCVAQRVQMAAEDGRQIFEESQKITQKIARSLSNGWSGGSS
jgi:hypothetical protein